MTMPPGEGNGIDIPITTHVDGDPAQQVRQLAEDAQRALREGVTGAPVELPGFDATRLYDSVDQAVARVQQRIQEASRAMGVALSEGVAGGPGLTGGALDQELQRYRSMMEASSGGSVRSTFVGSFAEALRNDTKLLSQGYDELQAVTAKGRNINWALVPEARQFLGAGLRGDRWSTGGAESFPGGVQHGQVVPAPPQFARPTAAVPGDLERAAQALEQQMSRAVVDGVAYQFENGQVFATDQLGRVLRARGPEVNPALLSRVQSAIAAQSTAVENDVVRSQLDRLVGADPGVSRYGMLPSAEYGPHGIPGREILPDVQQAIASNNPQSIRDTVDALQMLGVTAREAPRAIGALNDALLVLDSSARLVAQQALQAAHGPLVEQSQRAMFIPPPIGTATEEAENAQLAALRVRSLAAIQAREDAAGQALIRSAENRMYPELAGAGGGIRPPTGPPVASGVPWHPDDENAAASADFYRRAMQQRALSTGEATRALIEDSNAVLANARALSELAGITEETIAEQRKLADIPRLTPQATTTPGRLGTDTELAFPFGRGASTVGGAIPTRTDSGDIAMFNSVSKAYQETITEAELLARMQAEVADSTRLAAQAAAQDARSWEQLSSEELRAKIALEDMNVALAEQKRLTESGTPYERAQATLNARDAQSRFVAANQSMQAPQGFMGQFYSGLTMARGADDGGANAFLRLRSESGEFLGAIARYQAAYAVIFTVTRGLGAMLSAEKSAQDQQVEFSDATGLASDQAERFASSLGRITAAAGDGVAEAMNVATHGIYAFGDQLDRNAQGELTPQGRQQAQQVGTTTVQVASMAKVLTGAQDIASVETEVIGATRGFNLGFADQARVLDAAANASRNYGGGIDQILQGLPQVSEVAHQAGLSIEAVSNIMSLAITRSGQTGTSAANALDRTLLAIDQPGARNVLQGMGVDVSGQSGQVLESLAERWHRLSAAQQDAAEKALGGVRAVKTLLPVLQEGNGLLEANQRSYADAGYATELYYKRLDTIGGVIRQVGGDFKLLAVDLANTGVLDVFGVALKTLHPFLQGLDDVAKLIDLIPSGLRGWIVNLVAVSALLAVIGKQQAAVTAETLATGGSSLLGPELGAAGLGVGGAARVAETESVGVTRGFTNGLRMAGGALIGPLGLTVGVIGAVAAIGGLINATHQETQARQQSTDAEKQFRNARSSDDLRAAATALGNAAAQQRHANGGLFGSLVASPGDLSRPDVLQTQSTYAAHMADRIDAEQQHLTSAGQTVAEFFQKSADAAQTLSNGLDAMTQAGVPAVRQLELLDEVIRGMGGAATGRAGGRIQGAYATQETVAGLIGAAQTAIGGARVGSRDVTQAAADALSAASDTHTSWWRQAGNFLTDSSMFGGDPITAISGGTRGQQAAFAQSQLRTFDASKTRDAIQKVLGKLGPMDLIDPQTQTLIADAVVNQILPEKGSLISPAARARIAAQVRRGLQSQFDADVTGSPVAQMSTTEFHQFVTGTDASGAASGKGLSDRLQALAQTDDPRALDSSLKRLRAQTQLLHDAVAAAKARGDDAGDIALVQQMLNQSEHDLATAAVARIDRLRKAAEAGVNSPVKLAALEVTYVRQEVMAAAGRGDMGELVTALDTASKATINSIKHSVEIELQAAKLSYESAMQTYQVALAEWSAIPAGLREADPSGLAMPELSAKGKHAQATVDRLNRVLKMINDAITSVVPNASAPGTSDPVATAEARIQAMARPGNQVSEAQAALSVAEYAKAHAKNQADYWNAVKQVEDAEYQLTQAMVQHAHEARLTHIDQTDPVAMAREDLRTALGTLQSDRAHNTGDLSADEAAVQAARARAQSAAFSQRLQDVQTAHDLGRMSDAAYLRYLDNQSKRLHEMHDKTRQQIDEMNQIDEALKSAGDQMSGQWNIGTINIPTPYEVRRFIASQAAGTSYEGRPTTVGAGSMVQQTNTTHNHMTVDIKGVDLAQADRIARQIEQAFQRLLGRSTLSRAGTTTHRVHR